MVDGLLSKEVAMVKAVFKPVDFTGCLAIFKQELAREMEGGDPFIWTRYYLRRPCQWRGKRAATCGSGRNGWMIVMRLLRRGKPRMSVSA
jgi:hypothetical protein